MKENAIREKSFQFGLRIIKLHEFLKKKWKDYLLSKQILRSGTSIGALVREAQRAESTLDFIHKMAIAQKEADETEYWLELLFGSDFITKTQFESLRSDLCEIQKLLASIIITSKKKLPARHKQKLSASMSTDNA